MMNQNISKLETFVNFGFSRDPFKGVVCDTADAIRIGRILKVAVQSGAIVSIVGARGYGKTEAVDTALKQLDVQVVTVRAADKARLLISDVEYAMIFDLSDEKPKRSKEVRARQLRRVLGEASRKGKILVVIEEAHRMHGMTLRALKTLREMDWMGRRELFSVALIGQSDPMGKPGVSEVRLRSDSVFMNGLTPSESLDYISATVGRVFTDDAIMEVSKHRNANNFLDLQDLLVGLMARALLGGKKMVDQALVQEAFGKAKRPAAGGEAPKARPAAPVKENHKAVLRDVLKGDRDDNGPMAQTV